MTKPRDVVVLGSTGSIGTQAIDVVSRNPEMFRVVALGAGGSDVEQLARQALDLRVEAVAVARASAASDSSLRSTQRPSGRGSRSAGIRSNPRRPRRLRGARRLAGRRRSERNQRIDRSRPDPRGAVRRPHSGAGDKESLTRAGRWSRSWRNPGRSSPSTRTPALAQCLRGGGGRVSRPVITASGDRSAAAPDPARERHTGRGPRPPTWAMGW